jgi:acetyl-CoA C-acetyltransferase
MDMAQATARDAAIIGVGYHRFGIFPDKTLQDLVVDCVSDALGSCNVGLDEIDMLFFADATAQIIGRHSTPAQYVSDHLGLSPKPAIRVESACTSGSNSVREAMANIISGLIDIALVVSAEKIDFPGRENVYRFSTAISDEDYGMISDFVGPGISALYATRHMHEFGTTEEQLAAVAAKSRTYGSGNPYARFYKRPLTVEEVMASPYVVSPLKLPEVNPISEGACAAVLCRGDLAGRFVDNPVYVTGFATGTGPVHLQDFKNYIEIPGLREAGQKAYDMAGVTPQDIDVFSDMDAFSIIEVLSLEDLGFVEKGRGQYAIEEGFSVRGGKLPTNPTGGNCSTGGPAGVITLRGINDMVLQLREEGEKLGEGGQVTLSNGLALAQGEGGGGLTNQTVCILSREPRRRNG